MRFPVFLPLCKPNKLIITGIFFSLVSPKEPVNQKKKKIQYLNKNTKNIA